MYGISKENYEDLLKEQNFVCAICKKLEDKKHKNGKVKMLGIDHDHKTGKVRGLLCTNCNRLLGWVNDDLEILKNAFKYLEEVRTTL